MWWIAQAVRGYGAGWWNGAGWWWWWIAFVIIFFLFPLGYGWGYRGWGPWWRRRRPATTAGGPEQGWGCAGAILWIILIIAIFWFIAAWGWGTRY